MTPNDTELREEAGSITINGQAWEHWSPGQLLELSNELGKTRFDSWQLVQMAVGPDERQPAIEAYSNDLRREILAFRALGSLRRWLAPTRVQPALSHSGASTETKADSDSSIARLEYDLGREMAGLYTGPDDLPDPLGVTPM